MVVRVPLSVSMMDQKIKNRLGRRLLCGAALVCCLGATAPVTFAQGNPARVVQGHVVDSSDKPLNGATVYLKDEHTLSVKSYIANDGGQYRFGQLSQNSDYQLWAESNGKKSGTKNISSFDTRKTFDITLKVDK